MNLFISDKNDIPLRSYENLELSKKMRSQKIYNIAALEESPYTFVEVQTLLEGVTVGGHTLEDQQLILNQDNSWKELYKRLSNGTFQLNKKTVCELHSIVAYQEALEWGVFRSTQVGISGTDYKPPHADSLDREFSELLAAITPLHTIDRAINYFLYASKKQFFFDGNKRTARLVANGILLQDGYYIIDIPAKLRLTFNAFMIEFYETGNTENIGNFLLNVIKRGV